MSENSTKLDKFEKFDFVIDYEGIIEENCKELSEEIRQQAVALWGNKSKYAKGWTFTMKKYKNGDKYGVVHNKTAYQLSHLLEFGHVIWNSKKHKRTAPRPHILPSYQKQKDKFIKDMEKAKIK